MPTAAAAIQSFFRDERPASLRPLDVRTALDVTLGSPSFKPLLLALIEAPVFSADFGAAFAACDALGAIAPLRALRGALGLSLGHVFELVAQTAHALAGEATAWSDFAARMARAQAFADTRLSAYLTTHLPDPVRRAEYAALVEHVIGEHPHALYPTSAYRECDGAVVSSPEHDRVEAVMTLRTAASIRLIDRVFDPTQRALSDVYRPLGRCICLIDRNVHALYGERLATYFAHHGIALEMRVYRATEADKDLGTVEKMLGDFKRLGVARNEPVLIAGGGVLADTAGLACALYGRNTPYIMLATSIVSGIDAGPSPRTCCDGFGYKNLLGAYHPPVLCITDRFFFETLHEGWLRHGIAEIIKIALVTNAPLVDDLEAAQAQLVPSRFGTVGIGAGSDFDRLAQRILGSAMRSYIEAEYGNLYETHQCRPHAFGHTWSPGFEIEAGLLHGHAVSIDMGLGAYLSMRKGWIDRPAFDRILALISGYGLSLWHDILTDDAVVWESHRKIVQKRGGNLVAPVPKAAIGRCGYLNDVPAATFGNAIAEYRAICATYPRGGRGIDALCSDVGLAEPLPLPVLGGV